MPNSALVEAAGPMSYVLPGTRYFEIDSEHVGDRFAIWVTVPFGYDSDDTSYPVVYQVDGNLLAPLTGQLHAPMHRDPITPIRPSILVSVGYRTGSLGRFSALRARDLVPPGTIPPPALVESLGAAVEAGFFTEAEADLYREHLHQPRGERFLDFLIDELEPALRARFRVDGRSTGLWGFSYGGLFAIYAALSTDHFELVGASSPGPLPDPTVQELCERATADRDRPTARHLHLTVCQRELTHPLAYHHLGGGLLELMSLLGRQPIWGLEVSRELLPLETHMSGPGPSWFSFLRRCYPAADDTSTTV